MYYHDKDNYLEGFEIRRWTKNQEYIENAVKIEIRSGWIDGRVCRREIERE